MPRVTVKLSEEELKKFWEGRGTPERARARAELHRQAAREGAIHAFVSFLVFVSVEGALVFFGYWYIALAIVGVLLILMAMDGRK